MPATKSAYFGRASSLDPASEHPVPSANAGTLTIWYAKMALVAHLDRPTYWRQLIERAEETAGAEPSGDDLPASMLRIVDFDPEERGHHRVVEMMVVEESADLDW